MQLLRLVLPIAFPKLPKLAIRFLELIHNYSGCPNLVLFCRGGMVSLGGFRICFVGRGFLC
jgi:hypothetical protein